MFAAYFDESGTQKDAKVLSIGGYISSINQWERFEREWSEVLQEENLKFFHMTDFESRRKQFENWDNERRLRVIRKLIRIIKRRVYVGIGVGVVLEDYRELVTTDLKGKYGSPYSFAVSACMNHVARWANKTNINDTISYFFENGAGYGAGVQEIMNSVTSKDESKKAFRFASWAFADKKDRIPLQAADILAYETRKHILNDQLGDGSRDIRKSLEGLLAGTKHLSGFWDRKNIKGLIHHLYREDKAISKTI